MASADVGAAVRFQWKIGLATALPWLTVTLASVVALPGERVMLSLCAVVLGVPHVATTGVFYVDREMRAKLAADPLRFYVAPFVFVAVAVAVTLLAPQEVLWLAVAAFSLWQINHFTKQNLGVFSFVCKARGVAGPFDVERQTIRLTGYAGMLGAVHFFYPRDVTDLPALAGLAVLGWASVRVARSARGMEPGRLLALSACVAFYLPLFLFDDPAVALAGYGAAHAAQYLVMVSELRNGRERVETRRILLWFLALLVIGGWVLTSLKDMRFDYRWTLAIVQGITAAHFVIDADLWKMRDKDQRAYMARRFSFLALKEQSLAKR